MKDGETKVIEVPFEILVVCDSDGVVVQPGAHRITGSMLRSRSRDDLVVRQLVAVARQRAEADPAIRPMPRLKFLVERDGASNFWEARKQVLFTGLGWPMSLQVTGGQDIHLLDKEIW